MALLRVVDRPPLVPSNPKLLQQRNNQSPLNFSFLIKIVSEVRNGEF